VTDPEGSDARAPTLPWLLTSLSSAGLADGRGDLCYAREARGASTEWGGVYGQLIRLTGPWTVELHRGDAGTDLPSCRIRTSGFPRGWRTEHRWQGLDLTQDVVATDRPAGVVRRLELRSHSDSTQLITLTSRFSPYLFPVLVEGIRPRRFEVRTSSDDLSVRHYGFGLRADWSVAPSRLFLDQRPWIGGRFEGPVGYLASDHELSLPPGGTGEIRWRIAGGLVRDLGDAVPDAENSPGSPVDLAKGPAEADRRWTAATPELEFPDAPELEAAYRSARAALRTLYSAPDATMVGLVAGFPWYSAIWCRDLAVMLPALLWLGDFDWVERSLATVFRFQSRHSVRVLAGEPGELPMQLAPGPIFLYGTSDSTLRFPAVVEQLHRHTGDVASAARSADAVHRIVDWGRGRSDPATGLLRHGGEAETISKATGPLARVRYGIDSPDTTIWDSADRRDHAVDVQVLWWETLRAASRLLGHANDEARKVACEGAARRVAETIRRAYPWSAEHYLYDSLRGGAPVAELRPNALRAVSAGLLEPEMALAAVDRAAADDLSTPWGVRSLSSRHPRYDPRAYHEGQVWTIATAWAADAAFAVGQRSRGVEYLRTMAARYAEEGGFANECYRGDRPEPFNSCFLLGFSVAPFVTLLFERLWGIHLSGIERTVRVIPGFPDHWTAAHLRGLRIGGGRLDLDWTPGSLAVRWNGPHGLVVDTGTGSREIASGVPAKLDLAPPER
jgi:glycogen debranching enzyme